MSLDEGKCGTSENLAEFGRLVGGRVRTSSLQGNRCAETRKLSRIYTTFGTQRYVSKEPSNSTDSGENVQDEDNTISRRR